ncbi:hypothetical protein ACFPPF_14130 [Xenophilus aerolatus]|nr:hypothetical protein [Xenophilus aerolatus]
MAAAIPEQRLTDAESIELRGMIPEAYKSGAMWATRQRTRRETGGHIHYRKVFDAS